MSLWQWRCAGVAATVLLLTVPIEKIPSTESVVPLVGAGASVSRVEIASSKIAVVVVWMFCNRLMTDVPSVRRRIHGERQVNRSVVVLSGIVPVPAADAAWKISSPGCGKVRNPENPSDAENVDPSWAREPTVNSFGS